MQSRLERIEEKLDSLSNQVASYCAECRSDRTILNRYVSKHDRSINGNGKPGLEVRVDRVEQRSVWHSKLMWSVWGALLALATGVAANWIKP